MGVSLAIAADLCRHFEGFRSRPYRCPAGIPTIGYGSTAYADGRRVTMDDAPISEPEARALLMHELESTYLPGVLRHCPGVARDERRLNSLLDFTYNLGVGRLQTSTLRRRVNERNWDEAVVEIKKWNRGGGRVLPGLVARREAEAALLKG